jgi:hypothetical protein
MNRFDLQKLIAERALGRPLETTRPVHMSINQVIEAVWPLNERFRPHLVQIQSLAYDKSLEGTADAVIERWLLDGEDWDKAPPGVWRVLLERQYQVLQLLALKAAEAASWDAPFISVPEPADGVLRARLAIVFLLHSTLLPFPVIDRSGAELPQGNFAGTLTRH